MYPERVAESTDATIAAAADLMRGPLVVPSMTIAMCREARFC